MIPIERSTLTGVELPRAVSAALAITDTYAELAVVGITCMLVGFGVLVRVLSDRAPVAVLAPITGFAEVPIVVGQIFPHELTLEQCRQFGYERRGDRTQRRGTFRPLGLRDGIMDCNCDCGAHVPGSTKRHIAACCTQCRYCARSILTGFIRQHEDEHRAEGDEQRAEQV